MRRSDRINNLYFDYLCDFVCGERFSTDISYKKLFMFLHRLEFTYIMPRDANRAADGISLRWRFTLDKPEFDDAEEYLVGPCSIFEMLVGLALRCEETLMDDPKYGNRTSQWFWTMLKNMKLGFVNDKLFDRRYVEERIRIFLNREYEPNGDGGLFKIRNSNVDMREIEIWEQLSRYINSMYN